MYTFSVSLIVDHYIAVEQAQNEYFWTFSLLTNTSLTLSTRYWIVDMHIQIQYLEIGFIMVL